MNGKTVSRRDARRELKLQGIEPTGQAESQALEELIDQTLVLQEAQKLNAVLAPDELENQLSLARAGTPLKEFTAALVARDLSYDDWSESIRKRSLCDEVVRRQIRASINVKAQDIRDYYWEHVTQFRRSESVRLAQVFCNSRQEAEKAINELRLGDSISDVAARHSISPEAQSGGDLGWIQRKTFPLKLEKAAFALKKGKYSDIIATAYGWHILYAQDRRPEQAMTLEQSAPEILAALVREREQPLYRDWLGILRSKADIKRIETAKGKS